MASRSVICPRCEDNMQLRYAPRKSGGDTVPVYVCGCGGIFVPADQLKQVTGDTSVLDAEPGKWEGSRKCPACSTYLEPVSLHDVPLDRCPRCSGLFFDPAELDKVADEKVPLQKEPGSAPVIRLPISVNVDVMPDLFWRHLRRGKWSGGRLR